MDDWFCNSGAASEDSLRARHKTNVAIVNVVVASGVASLPTPPHAASLATTPKDQSLGDIDGYEIRESSRSL